MAVTTVYEFHGFLYHEKADAIRHADEWLLKVTGPNRCTFVWAKNPIVVSNELGLVWRGTCTQTPATMTADVIERTVR